MKHRNTIFAAGLVLGLMQFPLISQAWDASGHIVIAQIAYDNLTPVAQQDVDYLIGQTDFATTYPSFTPYIFSAPFPDYFNYVVKAPTGDTKDMFGFLRGEAKAWHYTDDPIVVGNYTPPAMSVNNSVWAIDYLVPNLSALLAQKNYNLAAYDLIFITHIVGDIHQPLHNATLYDSDLPNGDVGGNLYKISSSFGAKELHAAWDESLGQFSSWKSVNAGAHPTAAQVAVVATQFEKLCASDSKTSDLNPADWEKESHALAVNTVYPMNNTDAPAVGGTLSDKYIAEGQKIADEQMCLAGVRLANVLNKIFTTPISNS